jgi:phage shock protein C
MCLKNPFHSLSVVVFDKAGVYRQLYRARDNRMIGGICAGLGEYFNIDPTLIRLTFVFFSLIGFAGAMLIAYLVMLMVVPEEPLLTATSTPSAPMETPPMPVEEVEAS